MTTQDPELSAALGWPGGISDPVLNRVQLLRMVAALMQDKLWEDHRVRHLWDQAQEQAEPVPGAWVASPDGRVIYDDVSADDGLLRVSGDFENDEQRSRYAQRIVDKLNATSPKAEPVQEPVACNNTFACQCSKHFASQQSEQRPKRVLTAVWRDRAQRAEAQRDALLEALKAAEPYLRHADVDYNVYVQCRAAIKAVEEGK